MTFRTSIAGPNNAAMERFAADMRGKIQRAALRATDKAATIGQNGIRAAMTGARLGKLGNAIGATSDEKKGGRFHRIGTDGFSASGVVHVRTRSERALGALEAYTQGATITPRRGGWLWIATPNVPARVGRYRMTPERYRKSGLVARLGPLIEIPGKNGGERLLIVNQVTTRIAGRPKTRRLPRNGKARAGRQHHETLVMFIGIRSTSRAARVNPKSILDRVTAQLPG
jgi:hypothetical protein